MKSPFRVLVATTSGLFLLVSGTFFINNVASGTTPVSFDSGTASCATDSLGYCNGPTLPFKPNAVVITVQSPLSGSAIVTQAAAQLTATSFRARFFQKSGSGAATMNVTYSYVATGGTTPTPTAPPTATPTPTSVPTTTPAPTTSPTSTGSTGTVIANAYITGYGWPDNSPAGTAISDPVIHTGAGGVGTFADPITIAVGYVGNKADYAAGTKIYIPNVRRYFIVEDTCAACHTVSNAPAGTSVWVDMWIGGNGTNNAGVLACENTLTDNHTMILNPDANRVVVPGVLFDGATGKCATQYGG